MSLWGKRKGFRGFKEQEKVLKFDRPLAGEFRFRGFCDLWSQKGRAYRRRLGPPDGGGLCRRGREKGSEGSKSRKRF